MMSDSPQMHQTTDLTVTQIHMQGEILIPPTKQVWIEGVVAYSSQRDESLVAAVWWIDSRLNRVSVIHLEGTGRIWAPAGVELSFSNTRAGTHSNWQGILSMGNVSQLPSQTQWPWQSTTTSPICYIVTYSRWGRGDQTRAERGMEKKKKSKGGRKPGAQLHMELTWRGCWESRLLFGQVCRVLHWQARVGCAENMPSKVVPSLSGLKCYDSVWAWTLQICLLRLYHRANLGYSCLNDVSILSHRCHITEPGHFFRNTCLHWN